jgi:hypothetical protein
MIIGPMELNVGVESESGIPMYVSLHNRSAYSFGSALTRVEELAAFAADQHSRPLP